MRNGKKNIRKKDRIVHAPDFLRHYTLDKYTINYYQSSEFSHLNRLHLGV